MFLLALFPIAIFVICSTPVCSQSITTELTALRGLIISSSSTFNLDLDFEIPIPGLGDVEITVNFGLPLSISLANSSLAFRPIEIPYLIMPEPKPIVFDIPGMPKKKKKRPMPVYEHDPYSYDPYFDSTSPYFDAQYQHSLSSQQPYGMKRQDKKSQNKSPKKKKNKHSKTNLKHSKNATMKSQKDRISSRSDLLDFSDPRRDHPMKRFHLNRYRNKRSLAVDSALHRSDLFTIVSETLDNYGFDGRSCVCRAVCEMAEMDLLIETVGHEVIEHLLR